MTFKCQQKWQLDPPTQFNADVIYGCFLLLYFWQSSCRLGNCMSVWTQYENFNFIPAKKAIFKGQKMTSFPEIKSCYTKQIKTYSFVQSILTDAPEKNQFLRTRWVIKTCHEWDQNLFKIAKYKFILVISINISKFF